MSVIDEILEHNEAYASRFDKGHLPMPPRKTAGGVVTDDVIRSLTISQRLLETREIMLIHHTDSRS
jgi:carbonic anhydrase